MYKNRIRFATDEELRAVVSFYDAPELREYHARLIEDCRCELRLREIAKEDDDAARSETG